MESSNPPLRLFVAESSLRHLQPNAPTSFELRPEQRTVIVGREADADIKLLSQVVSRKHASIEYDGQQWMVRDLGSKAGTRVNFAKATQAEPQTFGEGDQIRIGPIVLNVGSPLEREQTINLVLRNDSVSSGTSIIARDIAGSVSTIGDAELGGLAQHRLSVLLKSAAKLTEAPDIATLAQAITHSAADGTSSSRALLIRMLGEDQWELLGEYPPSAIGSSELQLSRSLVALARRGKIAEMQQGGYDGIGEAMSIEILNIRSAICAPLSVDSQVLAVLYLDSRGSETPLKPDAASFCVALAQLGAMAIANLQRAELARHEKEMRDELQDARSAQQQLIPEATGVVGPIRYSLEAIPGSIVAGDLFDVVALGRDQALVILGDVMGKGAAAGLMMAAVQTFFRARSGSALDLINWVTDANAYFCDRFKGRGFITLWVGVFHSTTGRLLYVDAGHGDWCHLPDQEQPRSIESNGGPPLGAFPNSDYELGEISLGPNDRIVLFSDGLVEQHNPNGETFGQVDPLQCLAGSRSAAEDVSRLVAAQNAFRQDVALSDDLTIASIEWAWQDDAAAR